MKSLIKRNKHEIVAEVGAVQTGLAARSAGEDAAFEANVLENMRLMVSRVARGGDLPKRLSVVSAISGEGVTTICHGLGLTLANDYQKKVCLVNLNWYTPGLDGPALGAAAVLDGRAVLEDVIRPVDNQGNLFYLPAGEVEPGMRPAAARSQALAVLLDNLEKEYDHLILDIPALLTASDAVHLAGLGSACLLVIRQGVTPMQDIKQAMAEISHLKVLGAIINQARLAAPDRLVKLIAG